VLDLKQDALFGDIVISECEGGNDDE
jgi:hypothetical protein